MISRIPFYLLLFSTQALAGNISLTLQTAPAYALRQNADLAAARFRIEEARGRLRQGGRLSHPELELEASRNLRAPEGSVGITLMQKFPLTARLRLEKAVTRAELAAAESEVLNVERKLVAEVRKNVVKILALGSEQALRAKQLRNSEELARFTRQRVETGEISQVDASLLELESLQLQTEILQGNVERIGMMGDLRPLLGMSGNDAPIISGTLPALISSPDGVASLKTRPDFKAAESMAEAARQSVALARAQKWDDLGVGVNYREERTEDAPKGYQRETFAGLRLSLPLPFWNDNSGRVQEATAAASRAEKEIDALVLTIQAEVAAARETMKSLIRLIGALDADLLPKAAQIEEQLRTSYSSGQIPLVEVLRARDRRLLIERQRIAVLRDFHLARVRLLAALSQPANSKISSK